MQVHDGTIRTDKPDEFRGNRRHRSLHGGRGVRHGLHYGRPLHAGVHRCPRRTSTSRQSLSGAGAAPSGGREHFGGYGRDIAAGFSLCHDHGSQYMRDHFQDELRFLGIRSTPAFVATPEGNGCAERFIRTLEGQLGWIETFATVEELRLALIAFTQRYNEQWLVERHGRRTPSAVALHAIPPPERPLDYSISLLSKKSGPVQTHEGAALHQNHGPTSPCGQPSTISLSRPDGIQTNSTALAIPCARATPRIEPVRRT